MEVFIQDPAATRSWTLGPRDIEGIWYESAVPGGFSIAGWTDRRDVGSIYSDLRRFNRVTIRDSQTLWQGWMNRPKRIIKSQRFDVTCVGWSSRFSQLGSSTNLAAMKAYTFIVNSLLADSRLGLVRGDVRDDGYTAPALEVRPRTKYSDIMDSFIKQLDHWFWTVDENGLNWRQYGVGEAEYIVLLEECSAGDMAETGPGYANFIAYSYSTDGTDVKVGTVQDNAAIAAAGMVIEEYWAIPGKCSASEAAARATTRLTETKLQRMQAGFTTTVMLDARTFEPVDLKLVRAGSPVMVADLLSLEEAIAASRQVNSLSTFMMKNVRYENWVPQVVITPGDFSGRMEVWMARQEAKG